MPYGQIKVDEITFTNAGVDQTISVSGVVASISGNITATGTISGDVIRGGTLVSGATVTGTAGQFGTITGNTAGFTTVTGTTVTGTTANFVTVSGTTVTGTTAQFTTVTGGTAGFTTITGTTVTGTTANFVTVSGTTVTGNVGNFTTITGGSAGFTTVTGTTITGTTLTVASGTFTGNSTAAAFIPTGSTVPTNGVYLPSANNVAISTNGTGRLFIDSSGRLLVGVSSTSGLQTGARHVFNDGSGAAFTGVSVGNPGGGLNNVDLNITAWSGSGSNYFTSKIRQIGDGSLTFQTQATSSADGAGTTTERLRITSAGLVGIGTSSPGKLLELKDGGLRVGAAGGPYYFDIERSSVDGALEFKGAQDGFSAFVWKTSSGSNEQFTERMRLTPSGRLGIGTTTPSHRLNVVQTTGGTMANFTNNADADFQIGCTSGVTTIGPDVGVLALKSSSAERARIDSSGRLLVGTSSARNTAIAGTAYQALIENPSNYAALSLFGNVNTNQGSYIGLGKSRGTTAGAVTIVQNNDILGYIGFEGADGTAPKIAAAIECQVDGTPGTNDMPGRLVFSTTADGASSPTERMRINQAGQLLIGKASGDDTITGVKLGVNDGDNVFTVGSGAAWALMCNRQGDDGTLITFRQANTAEGTISVSGNTVSYNQFLGSHWAALTDWSRPEIKLGTILETINELTDWKLAVIDVDGEQKKICYNGTAAPGDTVSVEHEGKTYEGIVELETNPEFNKAVKVKVNDTAASKAVYGVFVGWNTDKSLDGGVWNDMYVGAVGNYVIRMATGQEPEIGDLVEADGTGCAVVQDDDIIRTKTVAKITSTIPQVTYDDGSFLVTCVLYCG